MFPNWTGWKTTKGLLFAIVSIVPSLVPAQYAATSAGVIGVIGAVVVLLSGTGVGPAMAAKVTS